MLLCWLFLTLLTEIKLSIVYFPKLDVDECSDPELNRCSQFADCLNTPGSYECKCLVGYIDMSNDRSGQHCASKRRLDMIMCVL